MNYPLINTERCQITIATANDACWLHALLNDRDVYKNIEGTHLFAKSVEKTKEFICSMLNAYNMGRGFLWKVIYKEKSIGFICIIDFDEEPSLCYALNILNRGKGLMHEALVGALSFLSGIANKTYRCDIKPNNYHSILLSEKLKESFPVITNKVLIFNMK